jgi:hypothetical protein
VIRTACCLARLRINFSDRYPLSPPEFFFIPPSPVRCSLVLLASP